MYMYNIELQSDCSYVSGQAEEVKQVTWPCYWRDLGFQEGWSYSIIQSKKSHKSLD